MNIFNSTKDLALYLSRNFAIYTGITEANLKYLGKQHVNVVSGVSAETFGSGCIGLLKKGYMNSTGAFVGQCVVSMNGNDIGRIKTPAVANTSIEIEGLVCDTFQVEANTGFVGIFDVYKVV